jgi:hypothetical protein
LFAAVSAANSYTAANGGAGKVSMSWGQAEFEDETGFDSYFTESGVVYFAATGDDTPLR